MATITCSSVHRRSGTRSRRRDTDIQKDGHTKDIYTHRETGRQIEIEEQTERQTDRQSDIRKEKQTDRYGNVFFSRCIENRRR